MDEGKFVADFIAHNFEKIWSLAKQGLGVADEVLQVKLKTAYKNYLSTTREKYSKGKSFFIRNEPVELYSYYVPTGIKCEKKSIPNPTFRDCVNFSSRIVITGTGGSGKSILMRHLFLDCIRDKEYAPVLIELRDLNVDNPSLDDYINNTLDMFGFDVSGEYVKRAKQAGHFCFFFDGYDEVNQTLRTKLIKQITVLSKKFPKCPIYISSRPDDTFNGIEDFSVFRMQPLDLDSAIKLVKCLPFDNEIKEKFSSDLAGGLFVRHKSFLSNPLLLSIMLLTYGENAEIPSKLSIFYNQAYEALFQRHDANKGGFSRNRLTPLDIQDFARVFALFALQTYEKRLFKMSRIQCLEFIGKSRDILRMDFKAEDYLTDLLSAACLLVEDGLEIAFSHRSFQEYFVAIQISSAAPEIQKKLIERYADNMRFDNVLELLLEINPDLVERELIVPQLVRLYSSIGVKNKVGVTHAVNYIKKTFSRISMEDEHLIFMFENNRTISNDILRMAVRHYSPYKPPSQEVHKANTALLQKKYCDDNGKCEYETKKLSNRSGILRDVVGLKGAFSLQYLAAGFEVMKTLKTKHDKIVQSFDNLLGIR